jgi:hypothetical protein
MPRVPFEAKRAILSPDLVREGEEKFITGPQPSAARPKSKLDILQEELEKIESRLGSLE